MTNTPRRPLGYDEFNGFAPERPRMGDTDLTAENAKLQARVTELEGLAWIDGIPPKPWSSEWFIAETVGGDKVALFPLPEEWSYDFKTADETYFCASRIKRWMQFPDSKYISFAAGRIAALSARVAELEARESRWIDADPSKQRQKYEAVAARVAAGEASQDEAVAAILALCRHNERLAVLVSEIRDMKGGAA